MTILAVKMFPIKPISTKSFLKRISFYYDTAPISYVFNHQPLDLRKRRNDLYQQQMKMSTAELSPSTKSSLLHYSEIFKSISESAPVQLIQKSLIDIHSYSGLPWWATIICSTVLLRTTITLPLAVYQQIMFARLELLRYEMNELVQELKKETTIAAKMYKWNEQTAKNIFNHSLKSNWRKLIVRDNCHPFKTTILLWVQIPLWISVSMSIRNMIFMEPLQDISAAQTFDELSTEGLLWIQNLTEIDCTYVLPIAFGLLNLSLIELATMSKVTVPTKFQKIITNIFRGFAIIMIPISASVPSALVLYWTTSSMFGLVQNLTLMSPKVKRFCRIPLTPSELDRPYKQLGAALKDRLTRRKDKSRGDS